MNYTDALELYAKYLAFGATVFALSYGADSLFQLFKALADPGYRND